MRQGHFGGTETACETRLLHGLVCWLGRMLKNPIPAVPEMKCHQKSRLVLSFWFFFFQFFCCDVSQRREKKEKKKKEN